MALDFPASPVIGQVFTGPNNAVWVWDGTKWLQGASVPVATTNPAYNNVGRNLIHNPLFNVAQRGVGGFATSGGYGLDRWLQWMTLDALTLNQIAIGDAARAQIGDEAATVGLSVAVTGNAGATSLSLIEQRMESLRRFRRKTVTVSFWAVGSAALKIGVSLSQNFGVGGSPSTAVSVAGQAVTVATTLARYALTFTLPSTAGKTLGTTAGSDFTSLVLWASAGANSAAASGGVGVQSGSFTFWGVQLEIGSVATPLEQPDPQQDLAKCQRFYQVGAGQLYFFASNAGVPQGVGVYQPQSMRATPTAALNVSANTNGTGISLQVINQSGMLFYASSVAGGTVNISFNFGLSADL